MIFLDDLFQFGKIKAIFSFFYNLNIYDMVNLETV